MGRREGAVYQMTSIMVWVGLFFFFFFLFERGRLQLLLYESMELLHRL